MTYTIHHYPVELIDVVHLANGRRVVVRPVLPQDGELHRSFFDHLSNESRYNRFLNPMQFFPAGMLERFTQIDYRQHFALAVCGKTSSE